MQNNKDLLTLPFKVAQTIGSYLIKGYVIKTKKGAKFEKSREFSDYLHSENKGLLLDGNDLKLTETESYQNTCVIARIGAGKTSKYIIPNVLNRASYDNSIVVNDPKGEVYSLTSQHMKDKGYQIKVVNPENLKYSSYWNPLLEARNDIELEQIAEILIKSGSTEKKDDFWVQGAVRFLNLFLKCLKNAGKENPAYFTLHNLYYLFQHFGEDGEPLDKFMAHYTVNPDDPEDQTLWNEWKGLLTGNVEGVQSFVLNAITALKALSNQNLAKITSKSDFSLDEIRERKTIVYYITPAQHSEYYSFFTSIFFRSVFNACMRKLPDNNTLPTYIFFDEFGQYTIPNFVSTANTIRGYKASLSIVLQSIAQLNGRYGRDTASSILGGFNTYITYSGSDPLTTEFFEKIIGKVRETQKRKVTDVFNDYREYNLINSNEVRTIPQDKMLMVASNKNPVLLPVAGFFQQGKWLKMTKKGTHYFENEKDTRLEFVRL